MTENELLRKTEEFLSELLQDKTTKKNIFWATDDYATLGEAYTYDAPITIQAITGEKSSVILPRVLKSIEEQNTRTKNSAEVFTPSWMCNAQNNLIDEAWFGRKELFNQEDKEARTWVATREKVAFPDNKDWKDYIRATRMEITCGEAPYLVSRYDTTTGEFIPISQRIGMLDRKLRVLAENVSTEQEWLLFAQEAYKHIYAYEWQGDNLFLARQAMLITFMEYHIDKFGKLPQDHEIKNVANIIAWNVFQMDGLKGIVPKSCQHNQFVNTSTLFGGREDKVICTGCQNETFKGHNGIHCLIREWGEKDPKTREENRIIRFVDLVKRYI